MFRGYEWSLTMSTAATPNPGALTLSVKKSW